MTFVELWVYLASTQLFGLTSTLVSYVLCATLYDRLGRPAWANPVMASVIVIGTLLMMTGTPYQSYFAGAQFIHVLLGPAVVALAWPLWERRAELKRRGVAMTIAAIVGGAAAAGSAVFLAWLAGIPNEVIRSLVSKSVTAPVAMGIAERVGGVPALAAVFAVLTGMSGALMGRYVFDLMRLRSWPVRGFALGTTAHGIGAARSLQVNADAGAYAGLALGLQALLAAILIPLVFALID